MKRKIMGALTALSVLAVGVAPLIATPTPAHAIEEEITAAPGRAVGSGNWGYIGQIGKVNTATKSAPGEFMFPYSVDVSGSTLAVTDSGLASWETGPKVPGHTIQTFNLAATPGSIGHGDYKGYGRYDVVATKSGTVDPHNLIGSQNLDYFAEGTPRGPRGVAFDRGQQLVVSSFEDVKDMPIMRTYPDSGLTNPAMWGSDKWAVADSMRAAGQVATDSAGNVYIPQTNGISVYGPDHKFITSMSMYFDQNGVDQSARITWENRMTSVPIEYAKPETISVANSVAVSEENGQTVVYLGDEGTHFQRDPSVHFQTGSSATGLKPASIKKYIVNTSGGPVSSTHNPGGWKWTLDTSFGTGGAIQVPGSTLTSLFGHYFFVAQAIFSLEADPVTGTLYYALNGLSGKPINAVSMADGSARVAPAAIGNPNTQQDSYQKFIRGIGVDSRGLLYASSQNKTTSSNDRAIIQMWGKTPSSIAGTATVTPTYNGGTISWAESQVGYGQPDLLDYVVKYRQVGSPNWAIVAAPGAQTSTVTNRTLSGLNPESDYEVQITPYNEAGSGDPAVITFRTLPKVGKLTVEKTGNGTTATTIADKVSVPANSTVAFEYTVTNEGTTPLERITLNDSVLGAITLPKGSDGTVTLQPGDSIKGTASGPVAVGDYHNSATAEGYMPQDSSGSRAIISQGQPRASESTATKANSKVVRKAVSKITRASDPNLVTATADWYGFGVENSLSITKSGNGKLAPNKASEVSVKADSPVDFTYVITNTGNSPVNSIALTDSKLGNISLPTGFSGTLAPQESVTATATGPVAAGEYTNKATVTGVASSDNAALTANTDWYGFGVITGLKISKEGAGKPSLIETNPVHVLADSTVNFTFTVTNTGNAAIEGLTLTDGVLGPITVTADPQFNGTLAAGTSATFTASGKIPAGPYKGTVDAKGIVKALGIDATASSVWYGFGDTPGLSVVKTGAGQVATTEGAAVQVPAGTTVDFAYTVTNNGNVAVNDVKLTDSVLGTITAPSTFNGKLEPNASVTFTAKGVVSEGKYKNTANVAGTSAGLAGSVTAATDWYGFGVSDTSISIVKQGNGKVATSKEKAIQVPAGKDVEFTYIVSNTGKSAISNLKVTDSKIGEITTISGSSFNGTLEPGQSVIFQAKGKVEAGPYKNNAEVTGTVPASGKAVSAATSWYGQGVKGGTLPNTGSGALIPLGMIAGALLAGGFVLYRRRTSSAS